MGTYDICTVLSDGSGVHLNTVIRFEEEGMLATLVPELCSNLKFFSNRVAYIKFTYSESVEKALEADGQVFVGSKRLKIAATDPTENPTKKLFFANVWDMTEQDLVPICERFGEVYQVDVVADRGYVLWCIASLSDRNHLLTFLLEKYFQDDVCAFYKSHGFHQSTQGLARSYNQQSICSCGIRSIFCKLWFVVFWVT
jgi:hypothetical protein